MKFNVMTYMLISIKEPQVYTLEMYMICENGNVKFKNEFYSIKYGFRSNILPENITNNGLKKVYEKMVSVSDKYKAKFEENLDELKLLFRFPIINSLDIIEDMYVISDIKETERIGLKQFSSVVSYFNILSLREMLHANSITDANIKILIKEEAYKKGKNIPIELYDLLKDNDIYTLWIKTTKFFDCFNYIAKITDINDLKFEKITLRKVELLYLPLKKFIEKSPIETRLYPDVNSGIYSITNINNKGSNGFEDMLVVINKKNLKNKNIDKLLNKFKKILTKRSELNSLKKYIIDKCYEDNNIIMYTLH